MNSRVVWNWLKKCAYKVVADSNRHHNRILCLLTIPKIKGKQECRRLNVRADFVA